MAGIHSQFKLPQIRHIIFRVRKMMSVPHGIHGELINNINIQVTLSLFF